MALRNDSDTDYISADSNRSDSGVSAITFLFWFRINTLQEAYLVRMGASERTLAFSATNTDEVYMAISRAGGPSNYKTTDFDATTATWYFIATVYNEDGTVWGGSNPIEFATGTLTAIASQRSASQTFAGSGATTALSNDTVYLSNRDNNDSRRLAGDIAFYAYFESELSLEQIQSIQFQPWEAIKYSPDTLLFPGIHGPTTVPDLSGNQDNFSANNMTVSPSGLPLPFFPFQTWMPLFKAAVGRTTKNTDPYGLGIAPGVSRTFKVSGL